MPVVVTIGTGATAVVITPAEQVADQNNGSITIGNVTGGVAPYTYDLNNTGGFTATTVYNNLAAGQYTIVCKRCKRMCFHLTCQ